MTYVLSDIHGNLQRFKSIMAQINLQTNDTLYVLGDVIDRYAGGIKILRQIMRMPNTKMLIGNHEYMLSRMQIRTKHAQLLTMSGCSYIGVENRQNI